MILRFCLPALFASLCIIGAGPSAQAYDPGFNFAFGYSLGQAYQFRNRLPAPPYFSVYPPVYYGQRYERPYGESPFASWPLLQSSSDYTARPKQSPVQLINPYVPSDAPCTSCGQPMADNETKTIGKMVMVENPYVISGASVAVRDAGE